MNRIPEFIDRLIAAGADARVAAILVVEVFQAGVEWSADICGQSVESPTDAAAERRRSADRARKKAARAAERAARTVCGPSADGADTSCNLSILTSVAAFEKQKGLQEGKKEKKSSTIVRATRLSADSPLSDADRAFSVAAGIVDPDALWVEFVDYWIAVPGQRGTKLNWSSTWRNRVRQVSSKAGGANGRSYQKRSNSFAKPGSTGADAILTGMARVAEKRFGAQSPNGERTISGGANAAGRQNAHGIAARGDPKPFGQLDLAAEPYAGE